MRRSLAAMPVIDSPAARLDARWRLAGLALLLVASAIARTVSVASLGRRARRTGLVGSVPQRARSDSGRFSWCCCRRRFLPISWAFARFWNRVRLFA